MNHERHAVIDAAPRASRRLGRLLALAIPLGLCRCGGAPPPPPPPTQANLTLSAAAGANPSESGQGAPVELRIYQLASPATFQGAEFFRLYDADAATLGADLVHKDIILLAPGASRSLMLAPTEPVHAIGVLAGLRDFRHATWRALADLPAHRTTALLVSVDGHGVSIAPAPSAPVSSAPVSSAPVPPASSPPAPPP